MWGQAIQQSNEGYLEDQLASVRPWGFPDRCHSDSGHIMHGREDKMVAVRAKANGSSQRPDSRAAHNP